MVILARLANKNSGYKEVTRKPDRRQKVMK